MTAVPVSPIDVRMAMLLASERQLYAIGRRRTPRYGHNGDGEWGDHAVGAIGEFAVAKLLGVYPTLSLRPCYDGDVLRLEVRSTTHPMGRLIIHPEDPDDRAYILVVGSPPVLDVVGWIRGADAKRPEWWEAPAPPRPPAFYVPRTALGAVEEFVLLSEEGTA